MHKYVELFFCRPIGIPDKWKEIVSELRLLRVILERLECSFARQEAKLDKLLNSQTSPCLEPPVSQRQQRSSATPSHTSTDSLPSPRVERFLEEPSTCGKYLTVIFLMFTLQKTISWLLGKNQNSIFLLTMTSTIVCQTEIVPSKWLWAASWATEYLRIISFQNS